jgi:hypothetical protein
MVKLPRTNDPTTATVNSVKITCGPREMKIEGGELANIENHHVSASSFCRAV